MRKQKVVAISHSGAQPQDGKQGESNRGPNHSPLENADLQRLAGKANGLHASEAELRKTGHVWSLWGHVEASALLTVGPLLQVDVADPAPAQMSDTGAHTGRVASKLLQGLR